MIQIILFLFVSVTSLRAWAESTIILKCKVSNPEWSSVFSVDAVGAGFLEFKKAGDERSYACGLQVEYLRDGRRAVSPHLKLEFNRGVCEPELGSLEKEIFRKMTLIVSLLRRDQPEGRVQWLRKKQPDACVVEKISLVDLETDAKKWAAGTWGRKAASVPKDSSR